MLTKRVNRRDFLWLTGVLASSAVAAACAPVAVTTGTVPEAPTPSPRVGGEVVTAIGSDPVGLDPCNPWHLGSGHWGMIQLMYDPWMIRDRSLKLQPYLAKSWTRVENFVQLQSEPTIRTWSGPGLGFLRLNVNHHRELMQDENVLQALRFGINRPQLVDTLTQGLGVVSGPLSPASEFYALPMDELMELQTYDPDRAKSLLQESGYDEQDNRLRLVCLSISGFRNWTDVVQVVQANLRDIGIDLEIRIQEIGVWVDQRLNLKEYDLSINDHGSGGFDPDYTYYRSDQSEQEWTGGGDPELDNLIDASNVEEDEDTRRQLILDIQRLLINRVREIYLYAPPVFEASAKALIGYTPWPAATNLRVFDWEQVYM